MSTATAERAPRWPRIARTISTGEHISLSAPSKMPVYGWGIPAGETCPGAKLSVVRHGEDAVCTECYAEKGFYLMPSVRDQQTARRAFIARSLAHDGGEEFTACLTDMILQGFETVQDERFRVHDAGDLYSVPYIEAWRRICEGLPFVRFWFPTRSWAVPALLPALQRLAELPNVAVRPSALAFDEPAPVVPGLHAGTTVARSLPVVDTLPGHRVCPATTGTPQCAAHGCDACWRTDVRVIYMEH